MKPYRENGGDFLLSVGGESAIETAKAISVMAIHPGSIEDYKRMRKIPENGISLIAILKTSGTGNEVMLYTTFKRIGCR